MYIRYPDRMPQDKMPECEWCNKDTAKSAARMLQKCYRSVTSCNKDATKVLQRCNII